MTAKEIAAGIILFAGALTGGGTVVGWVDERYMTAIRRGDLTNDINRIQEKIIDAEGVKALYEARLQDNGSLTPGDQNRYSTVLRKIEAHTAALSLLRQERASL